MHWELKASQLHYGPLSPALYYCGPLSVQAVQQGHPLVAPSWFCDDAVAVFAAANPVTGLLRREEVVVVLVVVVAGL